MRDYISRGEVTDYLQSHLDEQGDEWIRSPIKMAQRTVYVSCLKKAKSIPAADVVELSRDKLIELLSGYFSIGDSNTYELTRVKEAFGIGTMTFNEFVEWSEDNVANLADWLIKELKEEENDER